MSDGHVNNYGHDYTTHAPLNLRLSILKTKQIDPDEMCSYKFRAELWVKIDEAMHDHFYTEKNNYTWHVTIERGAVASWLLVI